MNVTIPIEGTARRVYLQIRKCDITLENVEALVCFRLQNGLTAGKSFTVLQAANVEAEYKAAKSQNTHNGRQGVVMTGAGNLANQYCKCIFHIEEADDPARLKDSFTAALRLAEDERYRSIAFSPIIYLKDNVKARAMAKSLMEAITDFVIHDKPDNLSSIVLCDHRVKFVQFEAKDPSVQLTGLSLLQVASVTYKKKDPHLHDIAKQVLRDKGISTTLPPQQDDTPELQPCNEVSRNGSPAGSYQE